MTDKHYQQFKKDLETFLNENFSVALKTDVSETNITEAKVNTNEVLDEKAIDGFLYLQDKYNFKNVSLQRSGPGLKILYTI
ncbi:hypothetical protein [Sediminibacter sp. Hel_I_10]|uniref:hypothetical protein n=1 Tax=Sediminibacter sp. Hel_I_10 TaxID=1392490 RepID=UPI00047871AF|nr:hypothetical protein [Sediminibacter sp. Hel_I_10]